MYYKDNYKCKNRSSPSSSWSLAFLCIFTQQTGTRWRRKKNIGIYSIINSIIDSNTTPCITFISPSSSGTGTNSTAKPRNNADNQPNCHTGSGCSWRRYRADKSSIAANSYPDFRGLKPGKGNTGSEPDIRSAGNR